MRKISLSIAILCLSAAWLMAQEPTSSGAQAGGSGQNATQSAPAGQPAAPSAQSGAASQSAPGAGAAAPSAQSGAANQSAPGAAQSDASIMQGCLGGSQPNYTLTDKKGTTYKLVTPPNADVSVLSKHIGEPIAVLGSVNSGASSSSIASGSGAGAASSAQPSIQVMKIGRGTAECPASSGAAKPKDPASKQ